MPKKNCTCSCGHKHVPKAPVASQPAPAQPAPAPAQPAPVASGSTTSAPASTKKLSKWQQFVKAKLPGMKDVPHKDRMRKVSQLWKEIQDDETKQAKQAKQETKQEKQETKAK